MKNKIIISLMFLLVVVLGTFAWQSISQNTASDSVERESVPAQQSQHNNQSTAQAEAHEKLSESESTTESNDQQLLVTVSKQTNEITDDNPEDKLCELVAQYDDWQKTESGYDSQKLMEEVRGWGNTRGYFEMEYNGNGMQIKKTTDYDYYETEDLQQMADAGDSIANVKLAYRLFLQGDPASLEEAQPYCERAIVDGYSAMLRCKTSYLNHIVTQHEHQEEPDTERVEELHIEIQAWQKLYELRNDPLGELFSIQFMTEVEGVEVDEQEVETKAQSLYAELKKRRNNLGLGEFNSEPAPDIIIYAIDNEIGEGAISECMSDDA